MVLQPSISADNPQNCDSEIWLRLKMTQVNGFPGTTPGEEEVTDALTVNASGSGSVHSIGTEEFLLFEGKDDVIDHTNRCNYRSNYVHT